MIIGILAIIKAGCTYLPINMYYPIDRVVYMLTDSNASMLLTSNTITDSLHIDIPVIAIDLSEESSIYSSDSTNLGTIISPEDLIYIIYTSGSTGKPKGSMICHRNVVRLFKNDTPLYDFSEMMSGLCSTLFLLTFQFGRCMVLYYLVANWLLYQKQLLEIQTYI